MIPRRRTYGFDALVVLLVAFVLLGAATAPPAAAAARSRKSVQLTQGLYTWYNALRMRDNCGTADSVLFGQASGATNGIDASLGEEELPPVPPDNTLYDLRFLLPGSSAVPVDLDFRNNALNTITWRLTFQGCSYPMTFTWDSTAFPTGDFILTDLTGSLVNLNMKRSGSVVVTNPGVTTLFINFVTHPVPVLSAVTPDSAVIAQTLNLVLSGQNFAAGVSSLNLGAGLTVNSTTVNDSGKITANVTVAAAAVPGPRQITVTNAPPGGGVSASLSFTVLNPVPALTSVAPAAKTLGDADTALMVTGNGFVPSSFVAVDGYNRRTAFVSSTQLQAFLFRSDLSAAGTHSISVFTPAPGGGTSSSASFTVNNPAPVLTAIAPSLGRKGQTLSVVFTGSGFIPGASTIGAGDGITVNSVSVNTPSQLTASLTITAPAAAGPRSFTVANPAPGGGTSSPLTFTVRNPVTLPTVSTSPVSGVTFGGALSGGNVTADGDDSVVARGVCWSTVSSPTTAGPHTANGNGTGVFASTVSPLSAGTTYYLRAYAVNSAGTAYGSELSFITVPAAPLASSASDVQATRFTAAWGAVTGAAGYRLDVAADSGFSVFVSGFSNLNVGTTLGTPVTGLTAATPYWFRVRAVNAAGLVSAASNTVTVTTSLGGLSVSSGSLAFGQILQNTLSVPQSYTVTGTDLTGAVAVSASGAPGFEIASSVGGPYGSGFTLPATGGTVWVRFHPAAGGNFTGRISNTNTAAASAFITVSGTGILPTIAGLVLKDDASTNNSQPVAGVSVSLSNGGGSATTDSNGAFIVAVPYNWSGRITPSRSGWTFTPPYQDFAGVTTPRTGAQFLARPPTPVMTLSSDSLSVAHTVARLFVRVTNAGTGTMTWTPVDSVSWLASDNTRPDTLTLTCQANPLGTPRVGTVRITTNAVNGPLSVVVRQDGAPVLALDTASWTAPPAGGTSTVFSLRNSGGGPAIRYTLSDTAAWLAASSDSGTTPGGFTITATSNTTGLARTGTVTITAVSPAGVLGASRIITVAQDAATAAVWPGDCDNNGSVAASDILPIGLWYGTTRPAGSNTPGSAWQAYTRFSWDNEAAAQGPLYADANGDGVIDARDVLAIALNYGKSRGSAARAASSAAATPRPRSAVVTGGDAELTLECSKRVTARGVSLIADLRLAQSSRPLYGLSFILHYRFDRRAGAPADQSSRLGTVDTSDGLLQTGLLFFREQAADGMADVAFTRLDGRGVTLSRQGSSTLLRLELALKSGDAPDGGFALSLQDLVLTDEAGHPLKVAAAQAEGSIAKLSDEKPRAGRLPRTFELLNNYPNPFNPATTLTYSLASDASVNLVVYDALGREVATLARGPMPAGTHTVRWEARSDAGTPLASGVYYYRLTATKPSGETLFAATGHMLYMK